MMFMLTLEKDEEAYLIDLDERWFHDIKPTLHQQSVLKGGAVLSNQNNATSSSNENANTKAGTKIIANEIKLLSTQIKALQETMEDLYETVFTSKLGKK